MANLEKAGSLDPRGSPVVGRLHRQPSWHNDGSMDGSQIPLKTAVAYKDTKLGDVVVERRVHLYNRKLITYHDFEKNPNDSKTWILDRNCELKPVSEPVKRALRPRGTWAITTAVKGSAKFVLLYEFTLDWPGAWAPAGYSRLTLGFEKRDEAQSWYEAIAAIIQQLKDAKHSRHASKKSVSNVSDIWPVRTPSEAMRLAVDFSASPVRAPLPQVSAAPSPAPSAATSIANTPFGSAPMVNGPVTVRRIEKAQPLAPEPPPATAAEEKPSANAEPADDEGQWGDPDSDLEDMEDDSEDVELWDTDERWVPWRQSNGVAIYYHKTEEEGGPRASGEYMVSAVVRGTPQRCADALMRLRGNTTILGPAARAEVLQPCGQGNKEVLRVVLTGTGYAGFFCAPREAIVERMLKSDLDEPGVQVIMFKSVELGPDGPRREGANCIASQMIGKKDGKPEQFGRGLWRRPVRCRIQGGYTIAGLRGAGANSEESLITCIVKVDLGGVCGGGSWLRPVAEVAGWTDNFLDRILMTVHLLRDELEQRRFCVQPFSMIASAKAKLNEEGQLVDQLGPAAGAAMAASSLRAAGAAAARRHLPLSPMAGMDSSAADASHLSPMTADRPPARMTTQHRIKAISPFASGSGQEPTIHEDSAHVGTPGAAGYEQEVPAGPVLDLERIRKLCSLPRYMWTDIHQPGLDAPFVVRGATYLKDRKKIPAGQPQFLLGSIEFIVLPPPGTVPGPNSVNPTGAGAAKTGSAPVEHIARFMPTVRTGGAPFNFIINLVIPGTPLLSLVAVFVCDKHPRILGRPPQLPMEEQHDWQPFDFVLHKFMYGTDRDRDYMLKLIPHIAEGSWMIKQSVGTKPVILGKQLKTSYHVTDRYIEIDIDISANSVANYVTGMVRDATKSLHIDFGFVLEGQAPWELPESLLGTLRLTNLDHSKGRVNLDWTKELPQL